MKKITLNASAALLALLIQADVQADCSVFKAIPQYTVSYNGNSYVLDLANLSRTFDFGGAVPIRNPSTNVTDIATINFWDPVTQAGKVLSSFHIPESGITDRVFKEDGYTAIGVKAGDGVSEGTLRTLVNSYPIPDRQRYRWTLTFRLAGATLDAPWQIDTPGTSPATIWQIKSPGIAPPLVMAVDTDPNHVGKLQLNFDAKVNTAATSVRLVTIPNIAPNEDVSVVIDAFLDNRTVENGGAGALSIKVNGATEYSNTGAPVLQSNATAAYQWSIGTYLYKNTSPLSYDRFTYWKEAKQEVCD